MKSRIVSLVYFPFFVASLLVPALGAAQSEMEVEPTASGGVPDPQLTLGVLGAKDYVEGIGDVVIPLFAPRDGLWFLNARASATDRSEQEYNIGTGYRHLIQDRHGLLGANLFFDRREARSDVSFDQIGVGAEYLSHFIDARVNAYWPLNDKKRANEFETREEAVARSTSRSVIADWDDPYAAGNSVFQAYEQTAVTRTSSTTTTTTRRFRQYEVAMRGWDAEIGVRLPIENAQDFLRLKAFAGYYHYYGRHGLDDVNGFRGRLEAQFRPALYLDATVYADDDLTGGHFTLGAYLSLPFDLTQLAAGRNPFSGASERWAAGRQRSDMTYRMVDMVKRDPQIRTLVGEPQEQPELATTAVSTSTSRRSDRVAAGTATVAEDITFVDGNRGDDANTGTFEDPKLTVQGGVHEPRSMVFVFDTGDVYQENVVMTESVNLRGEGCPLPVLGGKVFGSGIHPVVNAAAVGPTLTIANRNTSVAGFEIMNTPGGNGIEASIGENLLIACNRIHTTDRGVNIQSSLGGDVHVQLLDNAFFNNVDAGAVISGVTSDPDTFFVHARNNTFLGGDYGLHIQADGYESALAVVHDLDVEGARSAGIRAQMSNSDFASVLSLTDIRANNNDLGILADVKSDGIAAILGGMPTVLMELIHGAINGLGALPPEMEALLTSGGPIDTSHNNAGMELNVEGGSLGALALFDVRANNNDEFFFGFGLNATVTSPDGVALGFVGSSENFMEVLQLGVNVLSHLPLPINLPDIPDIPDSPMGPAQFNNNWESGIRMTVEGRSGAVGLILGVEANNTEFLNGINLTTKSADGFAVGALARVQAENNNVIGINVNVEADTLALGALYDFRAVNNAIGVNFGVTGDTAIGLMGSTDPLRSLANVLNTEWDLNPPLVVPGTPFGQSVASGNTFDGILAGVRGDNLALGVFLDINAQDNGGFGLWTEVASANGDAFGVFGSSDMLFDVVPPILGAGSPIIPNGPPPAPIPLSVAGEGGIVNGVEPVPRVAHTPLGDMNLSGNARGGLWAEIKGKGDATVLAGGITANDNQAVGGDGHGVHFDVRADDGAVLAGLMNLTALNNAGDGISIEANGDEAVTVALINALAAGNDGRGVGMDAYSNMDDVYLILAGVDALSNARQGIDIEAEARRDLGVAVTAVNASDNLLHGLRLNGEATAGEAFVWVGDLAIEDMRNEFGDYDLFGASDALYGFMPTGPAVFNNNGWDPDDPAAHSGMWLNLNVQDDITVVVFGGNEFSENSGNGLNLDLQSIQGDVNVVVEDAAAERNNLNGVRVDARTGSGDINYGLTGVNVSRNLRHGIFLEAKSDDGDVTAMLCGVTADNGNLSGGINLVLDAANGDISVRVQHTVAYGNGGHGFGLALGGGGGTATAWFEDVLGDWNGLSGIIVIENYDGNVAIGGQGNTLIDNTQNGIWIVASGLGGMPVIDFGGGAMFSTGNNSFFSNGRDFRYNDGGGATAMVENNWWGADADPVANGQTDGNVDANPWLPADPNP